MDVKQFTEEFASLKSQRDNLAEELQKQKDKQDTLSCEIENEKISVEHMESTIESLQETVNVLNSLLEAHEDELDIVVGKIDHMRKELSEMDQQLEDRKKKLDVILNDELCRKSLTANNKNSYYVRLKKNTSTTPIITEYCKGDKEFLILNAAMRLPNYKTFSYIIVRNHTTITSAQKNVPTMSELKSVVGRSISGIAISRMQYLKKCILSAANKHKDLTPNLIIPLSQPCLIGGQSDLNQTGYGWEWEWSYGVGDYTEGTYYGEMTGFSVIGIRINESDYY